MPFDRLSIDKNNVIIGYLGLLIYEYLAEQKYDARVHHSTAIGGVSRKLCNIIFAILREIRPYHATPPMKGSVES